MERQASLFDDVAQRFAEHLEFLGYSWEHQRDGWLYASHPIRWNFFFRSTDLGLRLHCTIHIGFMSDAKRLASLAFLNRLNQQSWVVRFSLDYDASMQCYFVRARTVGPAEYQRRGFGTWIDVWHRDLELLRDAPWEQEGEEAEESETAEAATVN